MADAKISADSSVTPAAADTVAGLQSGGNVQFAFSAIKTFARAGVSGTLQTIGLGNATSGTITLSPVSGALGSVTLSLPAATDTLVGLATTDTLTNKTLTSPVINGVTHTTATASSTGYIGIPQNSNSANYTTVLSDAGKHILHPSADTTARDFTIDGSVSYPVGTVIAFVNQHSGGVITIKITTDAMRLAGPGTTGDRTLAADGIATAIKVASGQWMISGTGLT